VSSTFRDFLLAILIVTLLLAIGFVLVLDFISLD
jgi:hypothetical protein